LGEGTGGDKTWKMATAPTFLFYSAAFELTQAEYQEKY
jgi:hypothetical protein